MFRGGKGTGKGTLGGAMMRIFGPHGRHISSAGQLIAKHNAYLRDCSFLFGDECFWPGDRSGEGTLKRLITEPTIEIEAKFLDAIETPNMLHVLMASNEDWVVPTSEGERRFVLFEVSPIHMQDDAWFGPLYAQLEDGGLGAMLFDLLRHDLGDWHPRNLPADTGLLDQQRQSLQPLDAWICELLESGHLTGSHWKFPNRAVSNAYDKEVDVGDQQRLVKQPGLFDQAKTIVPKLRNFTSDHVLGAHLKSIGAKNCKVYGRRGWLFPPLADMRRAWEQRFGGWEWADPSLTKWQAEPLFETDDHDGPMNGEERARVAELESNQKERRGKSATQPKKPMPEPRKNANSKKGK